MEATMHTGKQALARVLEQLGAAVTHEQGTDAASIADAVWPDFCAAVGSAMADMREREMEGQARWQQARHRSE